MRNVDVSSDGQYVLMCGESYSYFNFVNKTIQGFVMMVRAEDGSYVWGKYYQDKQNDATDYVGLISSCKFRT